MLINKSFDVFLIYDCWQILDDDGVVTWSIYDFITNLIVFADTVNEVLRQEEVQKQKS